MKDRFFDTGSDLAPHLRAHKVDVSSLEGDVRKHHSLLAAKAGELGVAPDSDILSEQIENNVRYMVSVAVQHNSDEDEIKEVDSEMKQLDIITSSIIGDVGENPYIDPDKLEKKLKDLRIEKRSLSKELKRLHSDLKESNEQLPYDYQMFPHIPGTPDFLGTPA